MFLLRPLKHVFTVPMLEPCNRFNGSFYVHAVSTKVKNFNDKRTCPRCEIAKTHYFLDLYISMHTVHTQYVCSPGCDIFQDIKISMLFG